MLKYLMRLKSNKIYFIEQQYPFTFAMCLGFIFRNITLSGTLLTFGTLYRTTLSPCTLSHYFCMLLYRPTDQYNNTFSMTRSKYCNLGGKNEISC